MGCVVKTDNINNKFSIHTYNCSPPHFQQTPHTLTPQPPCFPPTPLFTAFTSSFTSLLLPPHSLPCIPIISIYSPPHNPAISLHFRRFVFVINLHFHSHSFAISVLSILFYSTKYDTLHGQYSTTQATHKYCAQPHASTVHCLLRAKVHIFFRLHKSFGNTPRQPHPDYPLSASIFCTANLNCIPPRFRIEILPSECRNNYNTTPHQFQSKNHSTQIGH